jgi:hypothetical protein
MIQLFRHILLLRLAVTFCMLRATATYGAGKELYKETKRTKEPSSHTPIDFMIRRKHEIAKVFFICLNRAENHVYGLCL